MQQKNHRSPKDLKQKVSQNSENESKTVISIIIEESTLLTNQPAPLDQKRVTNNEVDNKLEECQNYHYTQSSRFSSLARTIVYAIIGTIWIVAYKDNKYNAIGIWLLVALGLSFLYLLLDLGHYFSDACSYKNEYFELDANRNEKGIIGIHENFMNKVSMRSYRILIAKFIGVIIIACVFIVGIVIQLVFKK